MKRFWFWLTAPKVFACGCGGRFRNEAALARHMHGHLMAEFRAARRQS